MKKIKPRGKNRSLRDDSNEEGDDDDEEEGSAFHDQESQDGEDGDEDSELHEDEDDEDVGIGTATIQRLKNDLFAEEEDEENGDYSHSVPLELIH